jgi:ribose-phosphate pyrophosphokinase
MLIVGGSASKKLTGNLANELGVDSAEIVSKRFPDDECYVRIMSDPTGEEVVFIQNTYPDPNIIELFLLQDALREYKIKKLITVIPYFGYARQDTKFNEGESISARALAKRIQVGTDAVITVDLHKASIIDWFDIPAQNVSGMPQIGETLKIEGVDIVVSPDKGAAPLAELTAGVIDCPWDWLEKTRIDSETVKIAPKSIDVEGKCVAIVDDIIATGGTIITASKQLKELGCAKVIAACTHGLYTGGSLNRIRGGLDKLISTDTLESESSEVTVAPEIKKAIEFILQ